MSRLVALLHRDGRGAHAAEVDGAVAALGGRPAGGSAVWCAGPVALAAATSGPAAPSLLAPTPLAGGFPGVALVHSARLDNRAELARALDVHPQALAADGDGELIALAWRRWGERCPERLLGDFAFVLWDGRTGELFAARDHVGMRLLYGFIAPGLAAFASEAKALLAIAGVGRRLRPEQVADFLVGVTIDPRATFYREVFRLLPGESVLVAGRSHRARRYHEIALPDRTHTGTPADVAAGFREVFTTAVKDRLAAPAPVGAMLSGGLDSSAIACVARDLRRAQGGAPLPAFSLTFPLTPACDESAYVAAVVDAGGIAAHLIPADRISPLASLDELLAACDGPYQGAPLPYQWATYRSARANEVRVLLDGTGGDSVVSHGLLLAADLVRRGRVVRALRELRGAIAHFHVPRAWAVRALIVDPLVPRWLRRLRRALLRRTARLPAGTFIAPDLARRVSLGDRFEAFWHRVPPPRGEREHHLRDVLEHLPGDILELASAACGVEQRCPFLDRRVIEYCLAVPSEQKAENGLTRMLVRRALAGVLPPAVAARTGKAVPGASLLRELLTADRDIVVSALFSGTAAAAEGYLDLDAARAAWRRLESEGLPSATAQPPAARLRAMEQIRKAVLVVRWLAARTASE
jgi:asparagine synthase (glutamine-hydrolysing)